MPHFGKAESADFSGLTLQLPPLHPTTITPITRLPAYKADPTEQACLGGMGGAACEQSLPPSALCPESPALEGAGKGVPSAQGRAAPTQLPGVH